VRHTKDTANQRQATINCCRHIALLKLTLADLPDYIAVDVIELQLAQIHIELQAQPALLIGIPQAFLNREIPYNGFLPRVLGLNSEMRFPESIMLKL
jgi:hypothetical protein